MLPSLSGLYAGHGRSIQLIEALVVAGGGGAGSFAPSDGHAPGDHRADLAERAGEDDEHEVEDEEAGDARHGEKMHRAR